MTFADCQSEFEKIMLSKNIDLSGDAESIANLLTYKAEVYVETLKDKKAVIDGYMYGFFVKKINTASLIAELCSFTVPSLVRGNRVVEVLEKLKDLY